MSGIGVLDNLRSILKKIEDGPPPQFEFGDVLTGFSGAKLMAALHGLTRALCGPDRVYVEIGVFQGLTLLSNASLNPGIACFGIDNFSLFNEGQENLKIVQTRAEKLGVKNAIVINLDFEEALHTLDTHLGSKKIGVLFVDGPHDYRSQLVSILKAKPYLADTCAIIVDDANYAHVRQANADFLRSHPDFALLLEAYTPGHMANLEGAEKEAAAAGWWNGANIIVRDSEHRLERQFPREESKEMYFESHEVFRHEFAELAFPAIKIAQIILDGTPQETEAALSELKKQLQEHRVRYPDRFRHQNTSSAGLSSFKLYE